MGAVVASVAGVACRRWLLRAAAFRAEFALFSAAALLALPVFAGERTGTLAGLHYLVFETGGARADAELPLLAGLHWSGASPEAMVDAYARIDVPMRVLLPQGPFPRRTGHSSLPDAASLPTAGARGAAIDQMERDLAGFVDAASAHFPTRGRPLATGVSYGGDLALLLALRHPRLVGAAFPVAARFEPGWLPRGSCAGDCPAIHFLHGAADTTVPMAPAQQAAARLGERGYAVTFVSYSGVAHDFTPTMQRDLAAALQRMPRVDR